MTKHLQDLLNAAKNFALTPEEKEQQRRSFAYGNTVIENPRITREMIDRAADELGVPSDGEEKQVPIRLLPCGQSPSAALGASAEDGGRFLDYAGPFEANDPASLGMTGVGGRCSARLKPCPDTNHDMKSLDANH